MIGKTNYSPGFTVIDILTPLFGEVSSTLTEFLKSKVFLRVMSDESFL